MDVIQIVDMAGATIEHSEVIVNFVSAVHAQLKDSTCKVYSDNVQYKWTTGAIDRVVIPDASINCRTHAKRGNSFFDTPRFVMEVLSHSTEKNDRGEKFNLYRDMEIDEYWIVDWTKKQVEIYLLDYDEEQKPIYYLFNTITEKNMEELQIVHFPNIKIKFEELFSF